MVKVEVGCLLLQVADGNENRQSGKTSQLMGLKFISLPSDQYMYRGAAEATKVERVWV